VLRRKVPYPVATTTCITRSSWWSALKGGGENLAVEQAMGLVFGYAVGVDLTRRDLQNAAKAKGHPWDAGKAFDASAPITAIRPVSGRRRTARSP
jgi:fumarylpyruvate hydrolase